MDVMTKVLDHDLRTMRARADDILKKHQAHMDEMAELDRQQQEANEAILKEFRKESVEKRRYEI